MIFLFRINSIRVVTRDRRYGIFSKNEYLYWMNKQIIFWMNEFFEWIFWPYNWMNYWMNQKSALFIRKMNKKCLFWTERAPFACFSLYFWFNFEWIILLNEYFWFNFELNIELNHCFARFKVQMNIQNVSPLSSTAQCARSDRC